MRCRLDTYHKFWSNQREQILYFTSFYKIYILYNMYWKFFGFSRSAIDHTHNKRVRKKSSRSRKNLFRQYSNITYKVMQQRCAAAWQTLWQTRARATHTCPYFIITNHTNTPYTYYVYFIYEYLYLNYTFMLYTSQKSWWIPITSKS